MIPGAAELALTAIGLLCLIGACGGIVDAHKRIKK
jgi:hypothetical protein